MFDGFWYRCEVKHYSVGDEWGDHSNTTSRVVWSKYAVIRETPKGVWLTSVPLYYLNPDGQRNVKRHFKDFVLGTSRRQLACPSKEAALADAIVRKKWHVAGCKARLAGAEKDLQKLQWETNKFTPNISETVA